MARFSGNEVTDQVFEAALATKSDTGHTHSQYLTAALADQRYYLKAQIDTIIQGLTVGELADHNHDGEYAPLDHTHAYLPLTGGVITGEVEFNGNCFFNIAGSNVVFEGDSSTRGVLEFRSGVTRRFMLNLLEDGHLDWVASDDRELRYNGSEIVTIETVNTHVSAPAMGDIAGLSEALAAKMDANADIEGIITDHSALTGLDEDDHPQYLTAGRGDARYYTKAAMDTLLAGKAATANRVRVSSAHTAIIEQHISVDTAAGAVTITAPDSVGEGAYFRVIDAGGTASSNSIVIDFGSASFDGSAGETFEININHFEAGFLFTGGTWRRFD